MNTFVERSEFTATLRVALQESNVLTSINVNKAL